MELVLMKDLCKDLCKDCALSTSFVVLMAGGNIKTQNLPLKQLLALCGREDIV